MSEIQGMAISKTYSLTFAHIIKVSHLADRFGASQGGVVRAAIDLLWREVEGGAVIVDDAVKIPLNVEPTELTDGDGTGLGCEA